MFLAIIIFQRCHSPDTAPFVCKNGGNLFVTACSGHGGPSHVPKISPIWTSPANKGEWKVGRTGNEAVRTRVTDECFHSLFDRVSQTFRSFSTTRQNGLFSLFCLLTLGEERVIKHVYSDYQM